MSRQILSYADLGPTTSVNTPIPVPASPPARSPSREANEPPRKRLRTDEKSSASSVPSNGSNGALNHSNNSHILNGYSNAARGNARKGKKPQRPGNPSGVPWTQHWDAQASFDSDGRAATVLPYEDDRLSGGSSRVGHASQWPRSTNLSTNEGISVSKAMPPPSFIGPVVPPSNAKAAPAFLTKSSPNTIASEKNVKGKDSRAAKAPKRGEALSFAQEEEWDDSVLIDAWNAAEEEYRLMNGGRKWRLEPVKHSTLWHDVPDVEVTDMQTSDYGNDAQDVEIMTETVVGETYEADTSPSQAPAAPLGVLPLPVGTTRSEIMEEAFRRAQEASYTAGYWAAIYQMHASQPDPPPPRTQKPEVEENGDDALVGDGAEGEGLYDNEEEEEECVGFLPTQR